MRFIKKSLTILLILLTLIIALPKGINAADTVPRRLNYQGRLMDSSDNLLTGTYYICFSIWDNATVGAGSQVWPASTPTPTSVTTSNGVFSAEIGSADTLDLDFDNYDYYLQVYVNTTASCSSGGETLSPRQHLTSAAYAINADTIDGYDAGTSADQVLLLDTEGDIDFDGEVFLNDGKKVYLGTGDDAQLYVDANDDLYIANATQDQDIYFQVNDGGTTTTPIFIQGSTGNVGIGTTPDNGVLEVVNGSSGLPAFVAEGQYGLASIIAKGGNVQIINGGYLESNLGGVLDDITIGDIVGMAGQRGQMIYSSNNLVLSTASNKDIILGRNILIDPTYDFSASAPTDPSAISLSINGTDAILIPVGTDAQRPSTPTAGMIRYNSTSGSFEGYTTDWGTIGGSSLWQESGSNIYYSSGNVGIGTDSPTNGKLVIANASATALEIQRTSGASSIKAGSTDGYLMMDSNGQQLRLNNYVSDDVILANGGGNVGIGTSAPITKLDVVKNELTSAGTSTSDTMNIINNGTTSLNIISADSGDSNILFSDTTRARGEIKYSNTDDSMRFRTAGTADRMIIDSSGNVGIGTTSPGALLNVGDAIYTSSFNEIQVGDSDGNSYIRVGQDTAHSGYMGWIYNATASSARFSISTFGGDNDITIAENGGNVGIGTTDPTTSPGGIASGNTILQIGGNNTSEIAELRLAGDNGLDVSSRLVFDNSSTGDGMSISFTSDTAPYGPDGLLFVNESAGSVVMKINRDNGNIGIGTVSPSYTLDIVGQSGTTDFFRIQNSSSDEIFTISDTQANIYVPTSFNTAGDVEMAYDLYFSNMTASTISSNSSIYIEAGDNFEAQDVVLRSAGSGGVVIDSDMWIQEDLIISNLNTGSIGDNVGFSSTSTNTLIRASSSRKYKHDIENINFSMDDYMQLRAVDFKWNDTTSTPNFEDMGLIAEEVAVLFPKLASYENGIPDGVRYSMIGVLNIEAIQELKRQTDSILNVTQDLQDQIDEIKAELELSVEADAEDGTEANQLIYTYDDSAILASIENQKLRIDALNKLSPLAQMLELTKSGELIVKAEYKLTVKSDLQVEGNVISANAGHSIIPLMLEEDLPIEVQEEERELTEEELLSFKQVEIENESIDENTQIMISETTPLCGNNLYVVEKKPEVGFIVTLEKDNTCEHDIEFDWWLVKSKYKEVPIK